MRLFNSEGSFESLVKLINESENEEELRALVSKWKPNEDKYGMSYWAKKLFSSNVYKLDFNKLPIVLDVFYRSNDRFKFILFCMLLDAATGEIPYLTNLEDKILNDDQWCMLKRTLCPIIGNFSGGFIPNLFLILLNNDPKGERLSEEEYNEVVKGLNDYLELVYNHLSKNTTAEPSLYGLTGILLDTATYINDDITKETIEKLSKLNLEGEAVLFLIKYQLVNGVKVKKSNIKKVLNDKALNFVFFRMLNNLNKLDILGDKVNQEMIATSTMIKWLLYPEELGKIPTDIKVLDTIEKDNLIYYLFKFKTDVDYFKDNGYMFGITGGYEKNKLTTDNTGVVFSKFEKVTDNYKEQAYDIIELVHTFKENNSVESQYYYHN